MFVDTVKMLSQNLQEVIFKVGEVLKARIENVLAYTSFRFYHGIVIKYMTKRRRNSRNVPYDPCLVLKNMARKK